MRLGCILAAEMLSGVCLPFGFVHKDVFFNQREKEFIQRITTLWYSKVVEYDESFAPRSCLAGKGALFQGKLTNVQ